MSTCKTPYGPRLVVPISKNATFRHRLGKRCSRRAAEKIERHILHLKSCKIFGEEPRTETANWVREVIDNNPPLANRLIEFGLIRANPRKNQYFAEFAEVYVSDRRDVTAATIKCWIQTIQYIVKFLQVRLGDLTKSHGDAFVRFLNTTTNSRNGGKLAPATVGKHLKNAQHFLQHAVNTGVLPTNPFVGVNCPRTHLDLRKSFVKSETIKQIMALADPELRSIIALARFLGLRIPSEIYELRWVDIDFKNKKITIQSPKKFRFDGHGTRVVPIFREVLPCLLELKEIRAAIEPFQRLEPDDGYVFCPDLRSKTPACIRSRFRRLLLKHNYEPWPKLFHNLRASRQTELVKEFSIHCVCEWLGNTPNVALKHYLMSTPSDFEKAIDFEA